MPLQALRFAGDVRLERAREGAFADRILAPQEGIYVARIQQALLELGYPLGAGGRDGFFGNDTGAAVSQFKLDQGLSPSDPVVGTGTMGALDGSFAFNPSFLDPAFAEFAPFVVARRVDTFTATDLVAHLGSPFDSWRRMTARSALDGLTNATLAGIVVGSRFGDLRAQVLTTAAPVQANGQPIAVAFDGELANLVDAQGNPISFHAAAFTRDFDSVVGPPVSATVLSDASYRNRQFTFRANPPSRILQDPVTTVAHELAHFRAAVAYQPLRQIQDDDPSAYVDTGLAQTLTATRPRPTVTVLELFVTEMHAMHVEWMVRKETLGQGIDIVFLRPDQLAAAVIEHMSLFGRSYDFDNDYLTTLNASPDAVTLRLQQAALWLRLLLQVPFSDDSAQQVQVETLLIDAADFCDQQVAAGATTDPVDPDGIYPLDKDFP